MRVRKPPKKAIPSKIVKIPKSLPLDFYHCRWLHKLPFSQQQTIPDLCQVAFLSNPEKSLFHQHMTKPNNYLIVSLPNNT